MAEELGVDPDAARCAWADELGGRDLREQIVLHVEPDTLIDFPDTAPRQMARWGVDPAGIRHVFITHTHGDHFAPAALVETLSAASAVVHVYGNTAMCAALTRHLEAEATGARQHFRLHDLQSRVGEPRPVDAGRQVVAVRANHDLRFAPLVGRRDAVPVALNYVLQWGDASLFYGCDSGLMLGETFDVVRRYRLGAVVLDMAFGFWSYGDIGLRPTESGFWLPPSAQPILLQIDGHQNLEMVDQTLQALRAEGAVADQTQCLVGHLRRRELGPHEPAQERLRPYGITLPHDGLRLCVPGCPGGRQTLVTEQ